MRHVMILMAIASIAGCGNDQAKGTDDAAMAAGDMAAKGDLAKAGADLAIIADLTMPPDLATTDGPGGPVDMAHVVDMAVPPDLAKQQGPMTVDVAVAPNGTLSFNPKQITVNLGDTVRWTWMSSGHTVTSGVNGNADGTFCSPNDQNCGQNPTSNVGQTYSWKPLAKGAFPYFCNPHFNAGMMGSVTVQ